MGGLPSEAMCHCSLRPVTAFHYLGQVFCFTAGHPSPLDHFPRRAPQQAAEAVSFWHGCVSRNALPQSVMGNAGQHPGNFPGLLAEGGMVTATIKPPAACSQPTAPLLLPCKGGAPLTAGRCGSLRTRWPPCPSRLSNQRRAQRGC